MSSEKIGATKIAEAVVTDLFPIPRHVCVQNVSWSLLSYEADLLCMTDSRYLIEVEIKISLSDLKRDAGKAKWRSRCFNEKVSRFYYAMPRSLWEKVSAQEAVGMSGVIVCWHDSKGRLCAKVEREAKRSQARSLSNKEAFDLARVGSFRAWSPQQKHRRRQLMADDALQKQRRAVEYAELSARRMTTADRWGPQP
jgi:hypothetical protein